MNNTCQFRGICGYSFVCKNDCLVGKRKMNKIRAYMAHPILGRLGDKATSKDIEYNIQKAIVASKVLEICIPELEIYCPGEMDEFPQVALWDKKYITLEQLLDIDCTILAKRDLLLVFDWQNWVSNGMIEEIMFAKKHGIRMYFFSEICQRIFDDLKDIVDELLHEHYNGVQSE